MNDRIDLNLFRVFGAIYQTGTLTRAAGQLHITQPAVSNALARLRAHFNDPLFVREGQRMLPTALARRISADVFAALDALHGSIRRTEHFDPKASNRRFVIAMREAMELPMLIPLVQELRDLAPGISIQSVPLDRKTVGRQLLSGEIDLAVDVPLSVGSEIRQARLLEAELCIAMRPRHPLLRKPLTQERWLKAKHVTVSGRSSGPVLEEFALQRQGLRRDVILRCQSYYAACHLVATSDAVLVLPRFFGEWFQTQLPLRLAPLPIEVPSLQIVLYWSRNNDNVPSHTWMRELIVKRSALSP